MADKILVKNDEERYNITVDSSTAFHTIGGGFFKSTDAKGVIAIAQEIYDTEAEAFVSQYGVTSTGGSVTAKRITKEDIVAEKITIKDKDGNNTEITNPYHDRKDLIGKWDLSVAVDNIDLVKSPEDIDPDTDKEKAIPSVTYVETYISNQIASVYDYKGSKTLEEIMALDVLSADPTNPNYHKNGEVYNISGFTVPKNVTFSNEEKANKTYEIVNGDTTYTFDLIETITTDPTTGDETKSYAIDETHVKVTNTSLGLNNETIYVGDNIALVKEISTNTTGEGESQTTQTTVTANWDNLHGNISGGGATSSCMCLSETWKTQKKGENDDPVEIEGGSSDDVTANGFAFN